MNPVREYKIDGRVFPFSQKNRNQFLDIANVYSLNDIISQIVLNTIPTQTGLPLTFQNGITLTPNVAPVQGSTVTLGGALTQNTQINGAGNTYAMSWSQLTNFSINSNEYFANIATVYSQSAPNMLVEGTTNLQLVAPNAASSTPGSFLQLQDPTGRVLYSDYTFPLTPCGVGQSLQADASGNFVCVSATGAVTNALSGTELVGTEVYLGGNPLLRDTTIDGDSQSFDLRFTDIDKIESTGTNEVEWNGNLTTVSGTTELRVKTAGVNAATASTNSILQLKNNVSGEAEYTPYSMPSTPTAAEEDYVVTYDGVDRMELTPRKAQSIYFDSNDANNTFPNSGNGVILDEYTIPAGAISTDGSYIDIEYSFTLAGTTGGSPTISLTLNNVFLGSYQTAINLSNLVVKCRVYRRSSTQLYSIWELTNYNSSSFQVERTVFRQNTVVPGGWAAALPVRILLDETPGGDHITEVEHLSVTKILA